MRGAQVQVQRGLADPEVQAILITKNIHNQLFVAPNFFVSRIGGMEEAKQPKFLHCQLCCDVF